MNKFSLTVLKIGGVMIGSFWSKTMEAFASILALVVTCAAALILKVTNPCPVVPLFGGRNPIDGSSGTSPAKHSKHLNVWDNLWVNSSY